MKKFLFETCLFLIASVFVGCFVLGFITLLLALIK